LHEDLDNYKEFGLMVWRIYKYLKSSLNIMLNKKNKIQKKKEVDELFK